MRRLPLRSPPRMRGKADHTIAGRIRVGITPAYAGKSRGTPFRRTSGRDHPRVCGEKSGFCQRSILHLGSPPRMRGKEQRMREARNSAGITPAYAGKSPAPAMEPASGRDHPRVCGEKKSRRCCTSIGLGSPPRVRGKAAARPVCRFGHRITPAYAGKRDLVISGSGDIEDHPRVCGEKNGICRAKVPHLGSPPRMRGKALVLAAEKVKFGITPAYAGKSGYSMKRNHITRDHPRVCGEKQAAGKLCAAGRGITPACAGKSRPRPHPRRCLPSAPWHGGSHGCRG